MFDIFKTKSVSDPELGTLMRKGGLWRGSIVIGGDTVPLTIDGGGDAPDAAALAAAKGASDAVRALRPALEEALREHRESYADDGADVSSAEVWRQVRVQFVSVLRLQGALTTELGLAVDWDEEHTLGARLRDGALLELNGSVLPP